MLGMLNGHCADGLLHTVGADLMYFNIKRFIGLYRGGQQHTRRDTGKG